MDSDKRIMKVIRSKATNVKARLLDIINGSIDAEDSNYANDNAHKQELESGSVGTKGT